MKILYILCAILMFGIMVLVHELGHFLMARLFRVGIKEFSVGMGPKLLSRVSKKSGIRYSLRLLPIGGFVSMVGEDEFSDDESALNRKPVWQRMLITVAGAVVNILCAVLVMSGIVIGTKTLGSTIVHSFRTEKGPVYSDDCGLAVGDRVLKVNSTRVHTSSELGYEIMQQGSRSDKITKVDTDGDGKNDAYTVTLSSMTVERDGERVELTDVVFPGYVSAGHIYGDYDFYVKPEEKTVGTVFKHAVFESWNCFKMIWDSLIGLLRQQYTINDLSGPVGVTNAISTAAQTGASNLLYMFVLISMNLGVFNLLPIPALDGGRLVFQVVEFIRRKPVKPEIEGYVHFIGICLLMLLMVVITCKDVIKLF